MVMSFTRASEFKAHAPSQWRTKLKDDCIRRIKEERTALIHAARQHTSTAPSHQTSLTAIIDDQLNAARRRRDTVPNDIECTPPPSQSASSHVSSPVSSDSSADTSAAGMSDGDDYHDDDVLSHDEYLSLMSELQHVIDDEMKQSSFDDAVMYDEMDESSLEAEYESSVSASTGGTILCPVCRQRYVNVKTHAPHSLHDKPTLTLACACGLNVLTDDCADAQSVSDRFANELITHDAHCPSPPQFVIDRLTNNNQWQVQSSALNVSMSVRPISRQMLRLICSTCQWNQPIKL